MNFLFFSGVNGRVSLTLLVALYSEWYEEKLQLCVSSWTSSELPLSFNWTLNLHALVFRDASFFLVSNVLIGSLPNLYFSSPPSCLCDFCPWICWHYLSSLHFQLSSWLCIFSLHLISSSFFLSCNIHFLIILRSQAIHDYVFFPLHSVGPYTVCIDVLFNMYLKEIIWYFFLYRHAVTRQFLSCDVLAKLNVDLNNKVLFTRQLQHGCNYD